MSKQLLPVLLLMVFFTVPVLNARGNNPYGTSWHAQWIWQEDDGPANTWLCFRKETGIPEVPHDVFTRIAAENKYWLYINGSLVVKEGGMDLRPDLTNTYYDSLNIAPYLIPGKNIIALLVWHKGGESGYSQHLVNKGGLLFEAVSGRGEVIIKSDDTWKVEEHPSFIKTPQQQQWNDYKWVEYPIIYDARKEIGNWTGLTYDDNNWKQAVIKGAALSSPWNNLISRTIPLFKDFAPVKLKNFPQMIFSDTAFTPEVGSNCQGNVYLKIDAEAGDTITIRTNEWYTEKYVTKEGLQEYTTYQWQNTSGLPWSKHCVEFSFSNVKRPVKILDLSFNPSGYNTDVIGSFNCSNERLNMLWQKCLNTSYVCMRDQFYDCPDRERGQWWGDVSEQILYSFYLYDSNASLLAKKGFRELMNTQKEDGSLYTTAPGSRFHLPDQNLAAVMSIGDYYMYTGDTALVRELYPKISDYVKRYITSTMNKDGMLILTNGPWNWIDWGDSLDVKTGSANTVVNGLFVRLIESVKLLANASGAEQDVDYYSRMQDKVRKNFNSYFWNNKSNAYAFHNLNDTLSAVNDDRSNAWAVLAGAVNKEQKAGVLEVLNKKLLASPYQERYIEEALFILNEPEAAINRMLRYYEPDIDSWSQTMWERMGNNSTNNHAWAASPCYLLGAFVAGIKPVKPGFTEYEVFPIPAGLTNVKADVPSPKGLIKTSEVLKEDKYTLDLVSPEGTIADVGIPKIKEWKTVKINGTSVWESGHFTKWIEGQAGTGENENYIKIKVKPGTWKFEALLR
jgi:hypothetical protein